MPTWTYSDIRLRLYPAALAIAFPDRPLTLDHLQTALAIDASLAGRRGSVMAKSPLFGRRIHIAGSVPDDLTVAPTSEVDRPESSSLVS